VRRGERVESARGGKEVHALDVARAVELVLRAAARRVAGPSFNGCDRYVSEGQVAPIAKELTGSGSPASDLNRGPKHPIDTAKVRALGLTFGGEARRRRTVAELVEAHGRTAR
jgi:hypothetical protein